MPKYEPLKTYVEEVSLNEEVKEINENIETKESITNSKMYIFTFGIFGIIVIYLTLSICLIFYQGWLLKNIKFPLTIVLYHLIIKFILSSILRGIYRLVYGKSRVLLDWKTSLKKIGPTGIASGIDIGFSNWGLALVQVSLYTMTKSTTIIFILIFAILLGLEKKSFSLILIVTMISGGLFMFTYKSTHFELFGFVFLLFASFMSGIRWSFAQVIMQKSKLNLHNPVDMIYHMQPWMILSILPFTIVFEGNRLLDIINKQNFSSYEEIAFIFIKITFGAILAFAMEVSEFLVLAYTSSLTLSITGIFKDICQLILAVQFKGEYLSLMNIIGLLLCLGGICCHIIHKYSTNHVDASNNFTSGGRINNFSEKNISKTNSSQNIPLLDSTEINNSDTDDTQNSDSKSASEVIFDILKRRDTIKR